MELLTFSINITLDGWVDHREGIADDETHAFFAPNAIRHAAISSVADRLRG